MARTVLIAPRSILLNAGTPVLQSAPVAVPALTSQITLRLARPTTAVPQNWTTTGRVRVSLVLVIDGVEQIATGTARGGIRLNRLGGDVPEYVLMWAPTVQCRQGRLQRIGETAQTTVTAYVRLERLSGSIETSITLCEAADAPAPLFPALTEAITATSPGPGEWLAVSNGTRDFVATGGVGWLGATEQFTWTDRTPTHLRIGLRGARGVGPVAHAAGEAVWHSSVAFDAATDAQEAAGDGVITLSHTPVGVDNLAAFAGGVNSQTAAGRLGAVTYDGVNMTEEWDFAVLTGYGYANAGYSLTGIPPGAKNVVHTLAAAPDIHGFGVITMTGVDQTVPTGTPVTANGTGATGSVTVGSVGEDDLVIDNLYSEGVSSIGADQTPRNSETIGAFSEQFRQSTQPGIAGGVMSWTAVDTNWALGAIAFKPVPPEPVEPPQVYHFAITQRVG